MHGDNFWVEVIFWLIDYWWVWIPVVIALITLAIRWVWKAIRREAAK